MSVLPTGASGVVADQDQTHRRIRDLLDAVTGAVLEGLPGLVSFEDHRPERDRPSGTAWRGVETMCHVSALLASVPVRETSVEEVVCLLGSVHAVARGRGMTTRADHDDQGVRVVSWTTREGDLLEVTVGVRVTVRAISAPFLPGSLEPMATTSPASAISPPTPPPRPRR